MGMEQVFVGNKTFLLPELELKHCRIFILITKILLAFIRSLHLKSGTRGLQYWGAIVRAGGAMVHSATMSRGPA